MKERRTLRIWQLIMLLSVLVLIPLSMWIPVLHVDSEVAENVIDDLAGEATDNEIISIFEKELLKEIPEASANGFDVMTFQIPEDEESSEFGQMLEDNLWRIQLPMWFLYLGVIPFIAIILIFFVVKRTKFVPLIVTALYAGFGIISSSTFLWKIPDYIMDSVEEKLLQAGDITSLAGNYLNQKYEIMDKMDSAFTSLWKELLSPGMYLTFALCILLFILLVVAAATGNRKRYREEIPPTPYVAQSTGFFQCVLGQYAGAEIPVDQMPIYVGSDPMQCQIVLSGPSVDGTHFSVAFDAASGGYQVSCFSPYGLDFYGPQYGSQRMEQGTNYLLSSGTQLSLNQGQETFRLL